MFSEISVFKVLSYLKSYKVLSKSSSARLAHDGPDKALFTMGPHPDTSKLLHESGECRYSGRLEFAGWDLPAGIEQLLRHSSCSLPKINSEGKVIFLSAQKAHQNRMSFTLAVIRLRDG